MKKLLSTVAAIVCAGALSYGANLSNFNPTTSGCNEASQLLNCINQLIAATNSGTSGIVTGVFSPVSITASTGFDQTLLSAVVNPNTLTAVGQSLRIRCFGTLGANANSKQVKAWLAAGTASNVGAIIGSTASNVNGGSYELELIVTYTGAATSNWMGRGGFGQFNAAVGAANLVSPVVASNATITWANANTAGCSGVAPTSNGDITAQELLVEQIK